MQLFLLGVINPSGWEIAAAIALWVVLLGIISTQAPSRRMVAAAGVSAVVLPLMRAISPLWLILIGGSVAVLASGSHLRRLLKRRDVRIWSGLATACVVASLVWTLVDGTLDTPPPHPHYFGYLYSLYIGLAKSLKLTSMVGNMGWLDAPLPLWMVLIWAAVVLVLAIAPLRTTSHSRRWVPLALIGAVIVLPIVLEAQAAPSIGHVWQGRYTLPLAAGIPIVGGWLLQGAPELRWASRAAAIGVVGLLALDLAALDHTLTRFRVGLGGRSIGFRPWHPAIAPVGIFTLAIVGAILLAAVALVPSKGVASEPA
jgi:hypothetical protein